MQRFAIVLKGGKQLNVKLRAEDADVAVYKAKKLGYKNISHAVSA